MTRSRRGAAALMTGALLLPLAAFAPSAAAAPGDADPPAPQSTQQFCTAVPDRFQPFTDIDGNTHESTIRCAAFAEITRGGPGSMPEDRYGGAMDVRRDQMASFIARTMDTADDLDTADAVRALPPYDGTPRFSDVAQSSVHFEAIHRLEQAGIVQGGPGNRSGDEYGPELPTQRDQMASFLNRAVAFMTGSVFETANDYFVDDEASVHEDNINGIASAGIAVGDGGDLYTPYQDVPRDQMASFLMRTLATLHDDGVIRDVGAATAAVVEFDQRGEEVQAGQNISGTLYGVDNATSIEISGACVVDGALTDADASQDGFQFDVPTRRDAAQGICAVTFTTTFEDGSTDTDTIEVTISGRAAGTDQTFSVAPMEPVETAAGEPVEFSIIGRHDDQDFTGPVDLTLFPCSNVEATSSPVTFTDANDDGLADGIATTENDQAYISEVEGVRTGGRETYLEDQGPGDDEILDFTTIAGPGADCAVIVVFDDQNDDRQLSVDAEGRPTEPFGVGKATWTGGEQAVEIAAVDADRRAVVLDGQTGEVLRVLLEGVNTDDPADNAIAVTPDRSAAYVVRPGQAEQDSQIVRISMSGGEPETVTQGNAPALRPDGAELAYVRFVDTGNVTPEPTIRLRNLATGAERAITPGQQDFYGIWDLSWTDDGSRIAFTAGEISTGVHILERTASSLDEAERLGPDDTEATWNDVASLGTNELAVIEQCCGQPNPDPQTWHVVTVDATTGEVVGVVFGQDRTEAAVIDDRDDGTGLIAVESRGPDGGPLLRWNGSDSRVRTLADEIIVAAW
jgi:hypothetical protein